MCVCLSVYVCVGMYVCVSVYVCVYVCTRVCVYVCVSVYVCVYVCTRCEACVYRAVSGKHLVEHNPAARHVGVWVRYAWGFPGARSARIGGGRPLDTVAAAVMHLLGLVEVSG